LFGVSIAFTSCSFFRKFSWNSTS